MDEGASPPLIDPHLRTAEEVLDILGTDTRGLSTAEAERRLAEYGPNEIRVSKPTSAWKILVDQLRSLIVALLLAAALIALYLGEPLDSLAVLAVLVLNTLIGFYTEFRARRAMESLLELQAPNATTIRDGATREIVATSLVPGDLLAIEAGAAIPADARVIDAAELRTNEAPLTGESVPAEKGSEVLPADTPLAERVNMLYQGTTIVAGSGRAVVVATGMRTELGKIGGLVEEIEEERTPLERRLDRLGRNLVWIVLGIVVIIIAVPTARGQPLGVMIETGIALAIAAVPEGLPAVVTITLAVSLRRMARRRALVRRLPAVESLGSATVICTDKTGTLTAGEMVLTTILLPESADEHRKVEVTGAGYEPVGQFEVDGQRIDPAADPVLELALRAAALSSHGDIAHTESGWVARGDPTEAAILAALRKAGLDPARLTDAEPPQGEVPFSSERKYAASFHQPSDAEGLTTYLKGAPDRILDLSKYLLTSTGDIPLTPDTRSWILGWNDDLADQGLRVLALATGVVETPAEEELTDLGFIGLLGIIDPPAPGVLETISSFHEAGIRTIMITGDQRLTAEAIARELGVDRVYSRVDPAEKLGIITELQGEGEIVAMLGDGVNDAAALKKADIGVAMGRRGTDAAKEASALVIQDDRFQTVAAAIEEGRIAFDNIRRFVFYLFSCNIAEILVLFIAGLAGYPTALTPLQILWLNLVTDTLPALSLAFEPAEPGIMQRPPRRPDESILSPPFTTATLGYGALITIVTLIAFIAGVRAGDPRTLTFMTIAFAQIFHLVNARGEGTLTLSWILSNPYALGATLITIGLQLLAIYLAPLADILQTRPLTLYEWYLILGLALTPAVIGQLIRFSGRR